MRDGSQWAVHIKNKATKNSIGRGGGSVSAILCHSATPPVIIHHTSLKLGSIKQFFNWYVHSL